MKLNTHEIGQDHGFCDDFKCNNCALKAASVNDIF